MQIGPPQFQAPYVLAYVDVDGVRVLAHADRPRRFVREAPVELRLATIGADEDGPLLSYAVAAASEGEVR